VRSENIAKQLIGREAVSPLGQSLSDKAIEGHLSGNVNRT
jgi:hypothetical protein